MMASVALFAGCSNDDNGGGEGDNGGSNTPPIYEGNGGGGTPPPAEAPTISLNAEKTLLTVGEYSKVTATNYITVEGQPLVFASSNPSAITVDANGKLEAISEGASVISVTYGEAKAEILVNSTFGGYVPELLIDGLLTRSISSVDTDQISPYIFFNSRRFGFDEGLTVAYSSSNTNVITVSQDGVVTGKGLGDATITVTATWRKFNGEKTFSLKKEVDYHVDVNTVFMINNDTAGTYNVYTKAEFEGQNYENVIDFNCTAIFGDEVIPASDISVVVNDDNMAEFNNGQLVGKAFGENGKTTATLSFTKNGTVYEKVVSINVIRPIATYADRIEYFSSFSGDYKDEADNYKDKSLTKKIFGDTPIVDVYQGDNKLEVDENGKILGVVGNFDSVADVTLRIGTQTERYDVSLDVYTKVIQNRYDIENTFHIETAGHFVTGYCEMIADVNMNSFTFYHRAYLKAVENKNVVPANIGGFRGVFNGNGHTISNYNTYASNIGGLFLYTHSYEGNYPVIKNVAFTDVKFGKNGGSAVLLAPVAKTTFENIYIKVSEDNTSSVLGALLPSYNEKTVFMKNVFVDVPNSTTINAVSPDKHVLDGNGKVVSTGNAKYGFGSLFKDVGVVTSASKDNFNSVFVVSPMPLTYYEGNDITFSDATYIRNYKDSTEKDPTVTVKEYETGTTTVKSVIRYNPYYYAYGANQTKTWDNKEIPTNSTFQNYEKFSVKIGAYYYASTAELVASKPDLTSFASDEGEFWIIKNGVPTWRGLDVDSYYTKENGKLNTDVIKFNEDKKDTTISITNYTDEEFDVVSAVSNNANLTATVNSDNKSITLAVVNGYNDWDNDLNVQITVTFGNNQTLVVNALVTSVIQKINDEVLFSVADGIFHNNNVIAQTYIAEAYQVSENGALSTLTVTKEGALLGVTPNITNGFKDVGYVTIKVITKDGKQYQFNKVKAYSGILTAGEHLKWFTMEVSSDKNQGHYIVANNINANKVAVPHAQYPNGDSPYNQIISTATGGFQGVFDGQGYTIDKMFAFRSGLFGRIFNDEQGTTEIKNVAFTNVALNPYDGTLDDGKKHATGPLFARFTPDTVLDDNYVAKYQTLISNVYIQFATPKIGAGYQSSVIQGLFNSYCEHNLATDEAEDKSASEATKIPLDKRGSVVSFKLVDCFIDYSKLNAYIGQKDVGGSGGGLIVSGDIGQVYQDGNGKYVNISEEIKNSRYENLFVASQFPLAVKRTSVVNQEVIEMYGFETATKVLDSTLGPNFYVTYASTMSGKAGYYGWKWVPYREAIADLDKYGAVLQDGYTPSDLAEKAESKDYKLCGMMYQFHENVVFTGDPAVDNDINKGVFFYTNVNQYGTLEDMATEFGKNANLYSGYDSAYWSFTNGNLTWKTAKA